MADYTEIFTARVRRCQRCGHLLTSLESVELGYGCKCREMADREAKAKEPIDGQMSILDFLGVESDECK